eukprot:gene7046-7837_t
MGKGKKGKKKNEDDDWEDDLVEIAKESGIELARNDESEDLVANIPKKKEKKKKHKAFDGLIDDEECVEASKPSKVEGAKASFSALMIEDDSEHEDDDVDEVPFEKEDEPGKAEKPKEMSTKSNKDKKGRKKKAVKEEDEDIAAILADLEIKDDKSESKKGKKKGKKKHEEKDVESVQKEGSELNEKENEPAETPTVSQNDDESEISKKMKEEKAESDEEGPKMKTAAQKKAEKKEREKKKKEAEKAKKKGKKPSDVKEKEDDKMKQDEEESSVAVADEGLKEEGAKEVVEHGEGSEEEEGEAGEGEKKKKKKKKKKGEEEKKKGKKLGKALIKQMQDALEKVKQEEERIRKEEEAKQLALEEAERQRLEKIQLEKEKKERKKQKEKERKERLKKEGKLLTAAEKEKKRKAEQMLEQLGIQVPAKETTEQRKKVQYVTKKKGNKQLQKQASNESTKEIDTQEVEKEVGEKEEPKVEVSEAGGVSEKEESNDSEEKQEPVVDNKIEDVEDIKESWDADSDDETEGEKKVIRKEKLKIEEVSKAEVEVKEDANDDGSEESEDEDEDDEEEDEDEDEEEESSEEEDSSSESEEEYEKMTPERIKEKAREGIMKRRQAADLNRSVDKLRCPVICVLGHVDTGKTKILDKIRHTNVQDGEAGGITQQIGATMVPLDTVRTQTKMVKEFQKFDLKFPGLLIIDTPGHESFSNLRTRGSSLCDMAILVVDIMHGLEPQTIESINLLRKKHTPFIVALNKIDRLFEWKRSPATQIEDTIRKQKKNTKLEFEERCQLAIREFSEQGLNAALFYKNPDEKNFISMVPTSAHSGDGMGDLMSLICKLTQTRMAKKLAYSEELQSTIMEVKALPGLGTTVDVILVNGKLREGDTIVTGGLEGPVVAQIRAILTPQPLRELRVKSNYVQHKELHAAQGCKITGKDLEKVMAGAPIFVAESPDEVDVLKDEVMEIVKSSLQSIKLSERGVYVQASTLGSLEALLEFLKTSKIPYSGVNIGPVHKKDVMKTSVMLEHEPLYSVILAFDVKVEREAQDLADKEGIKIFTADIIYHLFDKFTAYTEEYKQKEKDKHKHIAVFPCKLRILPEHIFNKRDPIVIGFHIEAGIVRLGTPLTVPSKEFCDIGVVTGIEANHKNLERATAGQEVCIKIDSTGDAPRMYGRHFTHEDIVMSKISRESIDALKKYFRDEMSKADWQTIIEMKKTFDII